MLMIISAQELELPPGTTQEAMFDFMKTFISGEKNEPKIKAMFEKWYGDHKMELEGLFTQFYPEKSMTESKSWAEAKFPIWLFTQYLKDLRDEINRITDVTQPFNKR